MHPALCMLFGSGWWKHLTRCQHQPVPDLQFLVSKFHFALMCWNRLCWPRVLFPSVNAHSISPRNTFSHTLVLSDWSCWLTMNYHRPPRIQCARRIFCPNSDWLPASWMEPSLFGNWDRRGLCAHFAWWVLVKLNVFCDFTLCEFLAYVIKSKKFHCTNKNSLFFFITNSSYSSSIGGHHVVIHVWNG